MASLPPMPPLDGLANSQESDEEGMPVSPVLKIHERKLRTRILQGRKAKKPVDTIQLLEELSRFVIGLQSLPRCVSINDVNGRRKGCNCLVDLDISEDSEELQQITEYLYRFALLKWDEEIRLVCEWIKYAMVTQAKTSLNQLEKTTSYLIPGTTKSCCSDSLCRLLGFGSHRWRTTVKLAKLHKRPVHAFQGCPGHATLWHAAHGLRSFFEDLEQLACPRATLLVRGIVDGKVLTALKDDDEDTLELPTAMSKRSIYGRFLRENGWRYLVDIKGGVSAKIPLEDPNVEQKEVCSWTTFLRYWKNNFPHIHIAKPREDVCGDCYKFANRHRFLPRKKENDADADSHLGGDTDDEEEEEEEEALPVFGPEEEPTIDPMIAREEMILAAGVHVKNARTQREYYQQKKMEAKETSRLPPKERTLCFVADYAQNMGVPSFNYEQPGETYYYSPLGAYCFGVVDCGKTPDFLSGYVYTEDVAKKGGNNVASLLLLHLKRNGFMATTEPFKDITFIFDNCGGQNKNRMVLRLLFLLVKMGVASVARAAFLVRGHTKNDCDRLFNVMKKEYRNNNIYTPDDLVKSLQHPQVEPVHVDADAFFDWDAVEEMYISRPVGETNQNHMFTVDINTDKGNSMAVAVAHGEPTKALWLVKPAARDHNMAFWKALQPAGIPACGLQDIKWLELYSKWGPLIPEQHKKKWQYYRDDPGHERRGKIKENTKKSKEARKNRTRTAAVKQQPKPKTKQPLTTGVI